jgi:Polysaccharide deacetylase
LTGIFAARSNHDGYPLHYSFYVNTKYITNCTDNGKPCPDAEDPRFVQQSWKEAVDHGNEIGVHTHSHPHGRDFSVQKWDGEIQMCINILTSPQGLGIPRAELLGFRTPYLEYGDATLTAVQQNRFVYDCSLEEGFQRDEDGRNFVWPYTLEHGAPGNSATYKRMDLPFINSHPDLWELPVYAFIVPPDELCERYGVQSGFRARMAKKQKYFEPDQGKITGMDWNLWYEYGMSKAEFLATLKYSLDLRLQGNRCPFMMGAHSAIYADRNVDLPPQTTVQERRDALREFLDYALSKPEVRVVNARELLSWLRSPAPFQTSVASNAGDPPAVQLGAGFRHLPNTRDFERFEPPPDYWAKVAQQMSARFPGSKPEGIWIVSRVKGKGTQFSFPLAHTSDPMIQAQTEDRNEQALNLFDRLGFRIWLQVEPGYTNVEKLIHFVLQRYSHHPCVVGVGVDDEWNQSVNPDEGAYITDEQARAWLAAARSYNPKYRLFLKHWLIEKMPPKVREGILFVDDSQIFPSMKPMVDEFAEWGKAFAPSPVAFQIGYPSDRPWWSKLSDPPKEIGSQILRQVPNTEGIFWVDFSVLEVFPAG